MRSQQNTKSKIAILLMLLVTDTSAANGFRDFFDGLRSDSSRSSRQAQDSNRSRNSSRSNRIETQSSFAQLSINAKQNWHWIQVSVKGASRTNDIQHLQVTQSGPVTVPVYFREGPGEYEILVFGLKSPSVYEVQNADYIGQFKAINTDTTPLELLPSARVESDNIEIQRLADRLTVGLETEEEIARAIHDWMAVNIDYDVESYARYLRGVRSLAPSSALRALSDGKTVCHGFSALYAALMRSKGIPTRIIRGEITHNGGRSWTAHDWNQIFLNGKWQNVDVTWDIGGLVTRPDGQMYINKKLSHKYYLPDEALFAQDHRRPTVMND